MKSKFEKRADMRLGSLRRYVEALGGRLGITAHFGDESVTIAGLDESNAA